MKSRFHFACVAFVLCCLAGSLFASPAQAQKGGGGTSSSTLNLDNWGIPYNGMLPQGHVTFTYSADGSFRSLSVQVSHIHVPDGTVVQVEAQELWRAGGSIAQNIVYYPLTIRQGSGTLSLSTTTGTNVNFLLPTVGQTNLYVVPGIGLIPMMGAQFGHLGS